MKPLLKEEVFIQIPFLLSAKIAKNISNNETIQ